MSDTQISTWATWLVRHGVPNRSDALDVAESLVPMLAAIWFEGWDNAAEQAAAIHFGQDFTDTNPYGGRR